MIAGETVRSGEDTRRRGWFWHWNSIVTQYAPLIGLKGVGLLNSYTVWTDRREESPHRGYAFPSQQSEADFYGEDRAELITINKILVALDLIEIRKEMVLRADEQGRRWRVPHNFYRVKDHDDDFNLNSEAVLRVVELADRDKTVYRYIRRIFSPRFSPIDPDNVWHRILPELRETEPWQRLAARAEHEENRASARTRAGHAARKTTEPGRRQSSAESDPPAAINDPQPGIGVPKSDDNRTPPTAHNDSDGGGKKKGRSTSVATTNKGLAPDVDRGNNGLTSDSPTGVDPVNRGGATAVALTNRTYNQSHLTTTTTSEDTKTNEESQAVPASDGSATAVTTPLSVTDLPVVASTGPGGQAAPVDVVGEAAAVRAYEDANGRKASLAEQTLLRQLAERFEPAARQSGKPGHDSGYGWIVAAIYEAVEAGSAYVAPRRIREIMTRWEREGAPGAVSAPQNPQSWGEHEHDAAALGAPTGQRQAGGRSDTAEPMGIGAGPDLALPHGFGSRRTWEFTVGLLGAALERERLAELVTGTWISGYHEGEVTLAAPTALQAERLAGEYRELVSRKLSEAMRRPIRLAVLIAEPAEGDAHATEPEHVDAPAEEVDAVAQPASFMVVECGLPSGQVWAAVLDEALQSGEISRANFDAWLRPTNLLGRGDDGAFIVGAPHALAKRRVASRFLPVLQQAVAAVVGEMIPVEIVVSRDWLRDQRPGQSHHRTVRERQLGA
jgi:hypothetical protein